jgi:subtilisin family serine protease
MKSLHLAGWTAMWLVAMQANLRAEKVGVELPNPFTPTEELLIRLEQGIDPLLFASSNQLAFERPLTSDARTFVFSASSVEAAVSTQSILSGAAGVQWAYLNQVTTYRQMSFTPDDVYFNANSGFVGHPGQWTLLNTQNPGLDARVQQAWNGGFTGQGVVIGIVDDSLEFNHEDLAPNYSALHSFNFGSYVGAGAADDPSPHHDDDQHGVSVAGIAAARGGNFIGVTGAAPQALLAGLRIDFPNQTTAMFVDADQYLAGSIHIKNHSYGISAPYIDSTPERNAVAVSAAAGTIDVVAAGNERTSTGANSNTKMLQASPDVIAVAALGSFGVYASYSSFGANVFVTAPSSTAGGHGVTTTDRYQTGDGYNILDNDGDLDGDPMPDPKYTTIFGGTSAATPLVSGVLALVKQANPNLNTRMAKHLLARTSDIVDPTDNSDSSNGGWRTNEAGFHFNPNYGFGLIDASEMVALAPNIAGMTPLVVEQTGVIVVNQLIPDDDPTGVSRTFTLNTVNPLEEILVTLNVNNHTWRGDLEATLTSPSGMVSRLIDRSENIPFDSGNEIHWQFLSNAFWGESAKGVWTINVRDVAGLDIGTFADFSVVARTGEMLSSVVGDFDYDLIVGSTDIDLILRNLTSTTGKYDLDQDADTDMDDVNHLLQNILNIRFGDANLDGSVDVADIALLRASLGQPKVDWAHGDFNGDGSVDAADIALLRANLGLAPPGMEGDPLGPLLLALSDAPGTSIPEPSGMFLLLASGLVLIRRRPGN